MAFHSMKLGIALTVLSLAACRGKTPRQEASPPVPLPTADAVATPETPSMTPSAPVTAPGPGDAPSATTSSEPPTTAATSSTLQTDLPETMKASTGAPCNAGENDLSVVLKKNGKTVVSGASTPCPPSSLPTADPSPEPPRLSTVDPLPPTPTSPAPSRRVGVPAEVSLGWLKNGNRRYVKGFLRKDGQSRRDIRRTSLIQKPHAAILGSADSRVPPELLFDQKLGEIFVVRNLGPSADPAAVASLEYAVEKLGVNLIVVLTPTTPAPTADDIMHNDGPSLVRELVAHSAVLDTLSRSGSLRIEAASYSLTDGKIDFAPQKR